MAVVWICAQATRDGGSGLPASYFTIRFRESEEQDSLVSQRAWSLPQRRGPEWPSWFLDRARTLNFGRDTLDPAFMKSEGFERNHTRRCLKYKVLGVARLTHRGMLTWEEGAQWDKEGCLWRDLYHDPLDAVLAKVVDVAVLADPVSIDRRHGVEGVQRMRTRPHDTYRANFVRS